MFENEQSIADIPYIDEDDDICVEHLRSDVSYSDNVMKHIGNTEIKSHLNCCREHQQHSECECCAHVDHINCLRMAVRPILVADDEEVCSHNEEHCCETCDQISYGTKIITNQSESRESVEAIARLISSPDSIRTIDAITNEMLKSSTSEEIENYNNSFNFFEQIIVNKFKNLIDCRIYLLDGTHRDCHIDKTETYFELIDEIINFLHKQNKYKSYYNEYTLYSTNNNGEMQKIRFKSWEDSIEAVIKDNNICLPLNLYVGCHPTIFVWLPSLPQVGHASLLLSDWTYISFWPAEHPIKWRKPNKTNTLTDDIEAEGREPDVIQSLEFFKRVNFNENAVKKWWPEYLETEKYNLLTNNCAHAVMKALIVGKVWNRKSLKAWVRTPHSVGENIQFIIDQTVNNISYRNKVFNPYLENLDEKQKVYYQNQMRVACNQHKFRQKHNHSILGQFGHFFEEEFEMQDDSFKTTVATVVKDIMQDILESIK